MTTYYRYLCNARHEVVIAVIFSFGNIDMGNSLWRTFFGYSDDESNETYEEAVERAKRLLREENYEDACRILKYAERQKHPEALALLGWCYWNGTGVREDAGRAKNLWKKAEALGYKTNKEEQPLPSPPQ